jgi:hypothetical protein
MSSIAEGYLDIGKSHVSRRGFTADTLKSRWYVWTFGSPVEAFLFLKKTQIPPSPIVVGGRIKVSMPPNRGHGFCSDLFIIEPILVIFTFATMASVYFQALLVRIVSREVRQALA